MIQKNTLPEKLEINQNNIELLKNQLKSTDRQLILTKLGWYQTIKELQPILTTY